MSQLVQRAQAAGSAATTPAGAKRYLLSRIHRNDTPLYKRGVKRWNNKNAREWRAERYERRAAIICAAKRLITRDDAESLAYTLSGIEKAEDYLCDHYPYKRSHSGWAGGNHTVQVKLHENPSCEGGSEKVWSSNGKWSGTDSYATFHVTARALMVEPTLIMRGHVVLDAEPIKGRPAGDYKLLVAVQGRGFEVNTAIAWLINGWLFITPSLPAALKRAAKKVSARLSA